jgi:hypothetical protein
MLGLSPSELTRSIFGVTVYLRELGSIGWLKLKTMAVVVQIVSYIPGSGSVDTRIRDSDEVMGVGETTVGMDGVVLDEEKI